MTDVRYQRFGRACACLMALAVATGSARVAAAGVADSPLPRFADGKQSGVLQVIPGVTKRATLQTDFLCTSFADGPVDIGIEIFDQAGTLLNDVSAGSGAILDLGPGRTVTIGTSATASYLESAVIPLTSVSQGSARVVATSDRVRCTVVVLDDTTTPPSSLATLGQGVQPVAGPVLPSTALPQFGDGRTATHAALVPGVIKRARMQTDFFCTSLALEDIHVGIEVFGPDGTLENRIADGNGAVLNVRPGATVTIGTTGSAAFLETTVIVMHGVAQGFARVVSTSGQVACAAVVLDSQVTPPVAMSELFGPDPSVPGDANRDGVVSGADLPAVIARMFR